MPAIATIKLAGRPFYRRKRFAALLATAAAIPLAANWMPSLFENGGPFAVNVPGQSLPSPDYPGDQVSSLREPVKELRTELSSTAMLRNADSASPDAGKDLDSDATPFPAASEFVQLTNSSEGGGEKMAASGGAAFGGAQLAEVDLPSVPEIGLVIVKGSKQDVEKAKEAIVSTKGKNEIASAPAIDAAERRMKLSDSFTKPSEAKASAPEDSTKSVDKKLSKAGGSSLGGMSGGGMSGGMGSSMGVGASPPQSESKSVLNLSTSMTPKPDAYAGTDRVEGIESLSVHNKRTKDLDKETPQLPAELRANAPHLFRAPSSEPSGTDRFEKIVETPFLETRKAPLSTFSIDVDTASYSKIRQTIVEGNRLPNPNMVRIEEMVNYFEYGYAGPQDGRPFAAHMSIDQCPWNTEHQLVRIGLQARKLDMDKRVKANIVFLLDVSGSMNEPNKLPLVKKALSMMVNQLGGTLVTVAKDVKIQVDFNQAKVAGYRLIGYEDRRLANKGFDNDQKDASEVGAGHRVTALYEVIPAGKWVGIVPPSES